MKQTKQKTHTHRNMCDIKYSEFFVYILCSILTMWTHRVLKKNEYICRFVGFMLLQYDIISKRVNCPKHTYYVSK